MSKRKYVVIYDGECGFCGSGVNLIKKLDWLRKFTFLPFQEDQVLRKYSELTKEMCEEEIYLVKEKGSEKIYCGGYDAFKIISFYLPLTFLISPFFFLPGITHAGRIVYKLIAKNRHKFSGAKSVCKIK